MDAECGILRAASLVQQTRERRVRGAVEHFYVLTPAGRDLVDRFNLTIYRR